jgi:hypothetical protein
VHFINLQNKYLLNHLSNFTHFSDLDDHVFQDINTVTKVMSLQAPHYMESCYFSLSFIKYISYKIQIKNTVRFIFNVKYRFLLYNKKFVKKLYSAKFNLTFNNTGSFSQVNLNLFRQTVSSYFCFQLLPIVNKLHRTENTKLTSYHICRRTNLPEPVTILPVSK